ncbi:MAG: hypothetical protein AUJ49_01435 [Desulfovibrionaceae bacterium CG1_02_65_16]|nr:MAG: hypothetical protein AUJ49_01435 [Desulfovibrionaceae bacterium CG1_02_65_16]
MSAWKLETTIGAAELPRLLRQLAQALETGAGEAGGLLSGFPASPGEVAFAVERQGADYALTLTARRGEDGMASGSPSGERSSGRMQDRMASGRMARETDAAERAREKYRQLKKLMQANYKLLRRAAEEGRMPEPEALESFLALCAGMAETAQPLLPAHGAEASELARAGKAFVEDAQDLRRAAAARNPRAMTEVFARLERRKTACHAQFR